MKARLAAIALLFALAVPANAADMYAGFSVGHASAADYDDYFADNFDDGSFMSTDFDDSDTGVRFFIGTSFNRNFSVELGRVDFGEASTDAFSSGCCFYAPGPVTHKLTADGLDLSAVGKVPVGEAGSFNVRLGFLKWDASESLEDSDQISFRGSDDGNDLFYAFGGEYMFSRRGAVRGEYAMYKLDDFDVSLLSLSLALYFKPDY